MIGNYRQFQLRLRRFELRASERLMSIDLFRVGISRLRIALETRRNRLKRILFLYKWQR